MSADTSGLTIYRELVQRSEEWYEARCGLLTASAVGTFITSRPLGAIDYACPDCASAAGDPCVSKVKKAGEVGAPIKTAHSPRATVAQQAGESVLEVATGDTARSLTALLATERITRYVDETPATRDMWRGIESEPFARDKYADENKVDVEQVGFMVRDFNGRKLGYSPDGLVGDDGLLEVKAPRAKNHLLTILADEVPAQHMPQLQAGLLVTGRKWIDFVSFSGGMPMFTKRVYPDNTWHAVILLALVQVEHDVSALVDRYLKAAEGLPMTDRIPDYDLEPVI